MRGRQTEYCNDNGGVGDVPPPYREVASRPPSWRSDDILVEKPIVAKSTEPRRRGVWRTIWDLLAGSKKASPQHSPRLPWPHQPTLPPTAVSSKPRRAPKDRWARPETSHTLQKGYSACLSSRHRYTITRQHCPITHLTPAKVSAVPWITEVSVSFDDLAEKLPQHIPVFENLDRCWADQVTVAQHPSLQSSRLFARTIKLAYMQPGRPGRRRAEWSANVVIWHRDPKWLAALKYSKLGALFFQPETSLR
jgi:hypothetical protein